MKILIADDDAVSRSIMSRLLSQCGYEVSTASNGTEAVYRLLHDDGPRLLLLDWMMPGLDGPEVCKAIRLSPRQAYVYITLLTSKDLKEDIIEGLQAGADDYLTKPCNLQELRARLRTGERILELEDKLIMAREEMRFRATHDGLTNLLNRTSIIQKMREQVEQLSDFGKQFAVVICDVDHFKVINDNHGHPVGDEVLREVAMRLGRSVRVGDSVGRFGGEEFLFVLAGCTADGLNHLTQAICDTVRCTPIETNAGPVKVSISAGAIHLGRANAPVSAERVLQLVDEALYKAKFGGRDQFILAHLSTKRLAVA